MWKNTNHVGGRDLCAITTAKSRLLWLYSGRTEAAKFGGDDTSEPVQAFRQATIPGMN
jgi:hypothetical protein